MPGANRLPAGIEYDAVGVHLDAQHLAAQVVGVGRAALGVVGGVAAGALVDRRVAVGVERVGVVAGGQVEVARRRRSRCRRRRGSRCRGSAGTSRTVTSLPVFSVPVGVEGEAGQPVDAVPGGEVGAGARRGVAGRGGQRRRVVEVDEAVGGEAGVDADALQAFLVVGVDGERADHRWWCRRRRCAAACRCGRCAGPSGPAARPATSARPSRRRPWRASPVGSRRPPPWARRPDPPGGRRPGARAQAADGAGHGGQQVTDTSASERFVAHRGLPKWGGMTAALAGLPSSAQARAVAPS